MHPGWMYVGESQETTHAGMILVPSVKIGGLEAGPAWFTWRSDSTYASFMSPMMAAPISGAVGGNVLGHFVMTVDFANAKAYFSPPAP